MILHLTAIHHRTAPLTVGSALTQVIDSDQCEGFVDTVEAEPYSKSPTKHEATPGGISITRFLERSI